MSDAGVAGSLGRGHHQQGHRAAAEAEGGLDLHCSNLYHPYDHSGHSGEAERVSLGVPGTQGQDDATAVQLPQIDCHRSFTIYFCVFEAENAIFLKILFARRI